ncbi:MAG: hypothetical protein IM636_01365, partial [Phenylobacterium sp.]|nr:hypothetical protein [Phenylobacterium sp.]
MTRAIKKVVLAYSGGLDTSIILTVITAQTPRVRDEDRIRIEPFNDDFRKLTV